MNKKMRIALIGIAVVAVVMTLFFPLYIQRNYDPAQNMVLTLGQGPYRIIIGNPVSAQDADYVCDGVNDHEQFQQAMDALPTIGGQLFVLAGYYNWGTGETVTRAIDSVSIIGVGGAVFFNGDGTTPIFEAGGDYWLFSNLQTDAGEVEMASTSNWMWLNIVLGGTFYSVEAPDDPVGGMDEHGNEYHAPDFATLSAHNALNTSFLAHAARHQNGGADEISVAGLSGLLADAQTALTHAASHENAGGDEISVAGLSGLLADAQTALTHAASHEDGGADELDVTGLSGLLADPQTIAAHDTTHEDGGADEISLAGLDGTPSALTTHEALDTGVHGVGVDYIAVSSVDGLDLALHVTRHENGGGDEISVAGLSGLLADAQTALTHAASHEDAGGDELDLTGMTGLLATAQTPTSHSTSHENAGGDEISLAGLDGTPSALTTHEALDTGVHGVTGDIVGTSDTQTLSNKTLGSDLDFAKYKAVAMVCDQGATVPASPSTGQWFLHTPTGRNVLMMYDGSAWQAIESIGPMTMYVDGGGTGTDLPDYGWGTTTNAFNTIQYAVDQIPPIYSGDVLIHCTAETYAETVTIQGKNPSGAFTITLSGALSSQETGTATGMTQGTGDVQGVLTDSGNPFNGDDYANMVLHVATLDEYRIIDGHCYTLGFDSGSDEPVAGDIISGQTSEAFAAVVSVSVSAGTWGGGDAEGTLTLHVTYGTFQNNELLDNESQTISDFATVDTPGGDAQDDNQIIIVGTFTGAGAYDWTVWDWGTKITNLVVQSNQVGVFLEDIEVTTTATTYTGAYLTMTNCKIRNATLAFSTQAFNECVFSFAGTVFSDVGGYSIIYRTKVISNLNAGIALYVRDNGICWFMQGSIVDGNVGDGNFATYGVYCQRSTYVNFFSAAENGYPRVRNCDTGVRALNGAQGVSTTWNQYNNNGQNENASAGSFGYID